LKLGLKQFSNDLRHRRYRFRQFVGIAFLVLLVLFPSPGPVRRLFYAGAALTCLGALVRLWAAGHVHKSKELARHGPYAFVRHPQYLGNTLLAVGLCLATGHWWAVGVWALILWTLYLPAIRREDEKLGRRFEDAWERWARKTPALIPTGWPQSNPGLHLADWSLVRALSNGEPAWLLSVTAAMVFIWSRLP
jgi:protein-S-isoprenylcysteine O-methyltransferase Ste14